MTVDSEINRIDHNPDGINDEFAYNFRVDTKEDMLVYADGVAYTAPFTITGLSNPSGGSVIFDDPPDGSIITLTLIREMELTQLVSYPALGAFPETAHERALDKLTWITQQLTERLNRSISAPIDQGEVDYQLPPYMAGQLWRWNPITQTIDSVDAAEVGLVIVGTEIGDIVVLVDDGSGNPIFPSEFIPDILATLLTVTGDIVYASAANTPARLAKGGVGQVLTQGASVPSWDWTKIVQSKITEYTSTGGTSVNIPWDDTIPQNTEGEEFFSVSITPKSASNSLDILVVVNCSASTNAQICCALFRDSETSAISATAEYTTGASTPQILILRKRILAGSTSAQTFKVRVGAQTGTAYINSISAGRKFGGVLISSITVQEVTP
jgi:hypothetical protein